MGYLGYKAPEAVDWSKSFGDVAEGIFQVGEGRKKRKQDLQIATQESRDKIEGLEAEDKDLYGVLQEGVRQGVDNIDALNQDLVNGRISEFDYKQELSRYDRGVEQLATYIKSFDEKIATMAERQANGVGGVAEEQLMEQTGALADVKNSKIRFENGKVYQDVLNPQTGEVVSTHNISKLNTAMFKMSPKIKLNERVQTDVKNWAAEGMFTKGTKGSYTSIESAKLDPNFNKQRQRLIRTVANENPLSVLLDYGVKDAKLVYSDNEYNAEMSRRVSEENEIREEVGLAPLTEEEIGEMALSVVKMNEDYEPLFTKKQEEVIEQTIGDQIDVQVGSSIKAASGEKSNWNSAYMYGPGGKPKENPNNLYGDMYDAWMTAEPGNLEKNAQSEATFNALAEGKYKFKWEKGGLSVYEPSEEDFKKVDTSGDTAEITKGTKKVFKNKIGTVKDLDDLQSYFYPKDSRGDYDKDKREYKEYLRSRGKQEPSKSNDIEVTDAMEKNIEATMKAYPDASREEVMKALGYI